MNKKQSFRSTLMMLLLKVRRGTGDSSNSGIGKSGAPVFMTDAVKIY
jgi:hypothetical protein